jgi:hypothetical protein
MTGVDKERRPRLADHAFNRFSQFGEDGILERIFQLLPPTRRVAVEFGAWDGFYLSNTANLWTHGWRGVLIEADEERHRKLVENTRDYDCLCINARVENAGPSSLDAILDRHGIVDVDLLSIDVDGDDYHVFASLTAVKPRVVCCEYNPTVPPDLALVQEPGDRFGCSALSLVDLAREKGYELVALTETNAIFVPAEAHELFAEYETSLEELFPTTSLIFAITSYDGRYVLSRRPPYGFTRPAPQPPPGTAWYLPGSASPEPRRSWLGRVGRGLRRRLGLAMKAGGRP